MSLNEDIESDISAAIECDDADALRQAIASSTDPLDGWLSVASQLGHMATLGVLLKHGVDVNWANDDGETAFSFACACNQFDAAKLLHANGANINSVDAGGATPLDWAVCHGHPEFRKWLRSVGGERNLDYDEWSWPPHDTSPKGMS